MGAFQKKIEGTEARAMNEKGGVTTLGEGNGASKGTK